MILNKSHTSYELNRFCKLHNLSYSRYVINNVFAEYISHELCVQITNNDHSFAYKGGISNIIIVGCDYDMLSLITSLINKTDKK